MRRIAPIVSSLATAALLSACGSPSTPKASSNSRESSTPQIFECSDVGGNEEWRVTIDLSKNVATFFDNDANVVMPRIETKLRESLPPQTLHIFEGADSNGAAGSILRVSFNSTLGRATVTTDAGKPGEKSYEAEGGCKAAPPKSAAPSKPAKPSKASSPVKFSCDNLGGNEEWSVAIDLARKEATFFDNDANVVIPQIETKVLESLPPQTLHIFEGADSNGEEGSKLRVLFNRSKLSATVVTGYGTKDQSSYDSKDGCKAE